MLLHKDSLDDSFLNQFKANFQTVVYSKQMNLNEAGFKYQIEIENRNFKSAKVAVYVNKLLVFYLFSIPWAYFNFKFLDFNTSQLFNHI